MSQIVYRAARLDDATEMHALLLRLAPEIPLLVDTLEREEALYAVVRNCARSGESWVAANAAGDIVGIVVVEPNERGRHYAENEVLDLRYAAVMPKAAPEDRGELLHPGGVADQGDDGAGGLVAQVVLQSDEIGILGQRLAGDGGLGHPCDLHQDLGGLRGAGPGTGEHQRGREIPLAKPAAHLALHLAALLGQRTVAVVGPLRGVTLTGVGVAVEEEEHESLESGKGEG